MAEDDDSLRRLIRPAWPLVAHLLCLVGSVAALLTAIGGVPYETATILASLLLAASGIFAIVGQRSFIRVRGLDLATDDPLKRAALERGNAYLMGGLLIAVAVAWLAVTLIQS